MKFSLTLITVLCASLVSVPMAAASGGGHGEEKKDSAKAKAPKKARPYTSLRSWVLVDPFTISIIQDGRIRGRFTVSFGMDVSDDELRETAEALMPRLRDAWLGELSLHAGTSLRPRRPADVASIADMLQATADRVLGKAGAKVLMAQATVLITQ